MTPAEKPSLIRIGTRGSALALAQARRVGELLEAAHPGVAVEIVTIDTQGDRDKTSSLTVIGGQGVFTSAVQAELLAGHVDIAVHSAKDLPAVSPEGLVIAAFPEREDARDVLVSRHGSTLADLPEAPVIGTSSRRRAMELLALRPDARIHDLRGNIDTRLRKSESAELDAIVLAAAGLVRLAWHDRVSEWLPIDQFVPAPGQGALAVEVRATDRVMVEALAAIDDPEAGIAVRAERAFLSAVGAGCTVPLGAHVRREGSAWVLRAVFGEMGGQAARLVRELDPERMNADAAAAAIELIHRQFSGRNRPRVLVTRAEAQAEPLSAALVAAGMAPVIYPVLRIEAPESVDELDDEIRRLASGGYDWVVFTSANAVESVATRLAALALDVTGLGEVSIAAVGRATAGAVSRYGWPVPFVPGEATGASLGEELAERIGPGSRVLHPRGNLARDEVAQRIEAAGASVTPVVAYCTVAEDRPHPHDESVRRGDVDVVTFASPSSVRNLVRRLGGLGPIARARVVCVGPVTAEEARTHGLVVHAVAPDASVGGLVAAIRAAVLDEATVLGGTRPGERS